MPDEAGNLTSVEQAQTMAIVAAANNDDDNSADAIENMVDMQRWSRDPDAKKMFKEINKDLGFGILKIKQWQQLMDYLNLFALYSYIEGDKATEKDSDSYFFLRKSYVLCTTSRSIDGKGLLTLGEQTRNIQIGSNIPGIAPQQPKQEGFLNRLNPLNKGR